MAGRFKEWQVRFGDVNLWIWAAVLLITSGGVQEMVLTTLRGALSSTLGSPDWPGLIFLAAFLVSAVQVYRITTRNFKPRTRQLTVDRNPSPRKHLVLFLSNLDNEAAFDHGVPIGLELTGRLGEDIRSAALKFRWPWEMTLRALSHHSGTLDTATFVCSEKSLPQLPWFLQICRDYPELSQVRFAVLLKGGRTIWFLDREAPSIFNSSQGWDFESFDGLSKAMFELLEDFRKRKIPEREIMIDFTGGQKVTSAVAVALTFNRGIRAQYVQTNSPKEVLSYDVVFGTSELGPLQPW